MKLTSKLSFLGASIVTNTLHEFKKNDSFFHNNHVQRLTFCRVAPETRETTSRIESHRPGTKPIQNTENKKQIHRPDTKSIQNTENKKRVLHNLSLLASSMATAKE